VIPRRVRGRDILVPFWIELDESGDGITHRSPLGYGVTAFDQEDALSLLREHVFGGAEMPPTRSVIDDVDLSALDEGHVRPNMETPVFRGVWFPRGYKDPSG
jgi:hypothetical protein